jgi:cytochrome c biogenesis protein ResB
MLILLTYTRSVWVRLKSKDDGVEVAVAGRSYTNKAGLEKELKYLLAELKDNLERSA